MLVLFRWKPGYVLHPPLLLHDALVALGHLPRLLCPRSAQRVLPLFISLPHQLLQAPVTEHNLHERKLRRTVFDI